MKKLAAFGCALMMLMTACGACFAETMEAETVNAENVLRIAETAEGTAKQAGNDTLNLVMDVCIILAVAVAGVIVLRRIKKKSREIGRQVKNRAVVPEEIEEALKKEEKK